MSRICRVARRAPPASSVSPQATPLPASAAAALDRSAGLPPSSAMRIRHSYASSRVNVVFVPRNVAAAVQKFCASTASILRPYPSGLRSVKNQVRSLIDDNFRLCHTGFTDLVETNVSLDEWRISKGWNYSDLARSIGVSPEAARRYCTGQRRMPSHNVLRQIGALTSGAVTADDFARQHDVNVSGTLL